MLTIPVPGGQPTWRVETAVREPGHRAQCEPDRDQRSCSSCNSSLAFLPPRSMSLQKPLRKCRPIHNPRWAPPDPAANCMAPVPQLKPEVYGHPQLLVFWGRLLKKQSLFRCSIPCPSQGSRGAPVSFSFSQAYLQFLLPLPSQPHSSLSSQLFPPAPWDPRKTLPPMAPSLCCLGLRRAGNARMVSVSAKSHMDMTQPALSTWGSHFQLMSVAFPSLQHPVTGPVWSLLGEDLPSYQSPTTGYWIL